MSRQSKENLGRLVKGRRRNPPDCRRLSNSSVNHCDYATIGAFPAPCQPHHLSASEAPGRNTIQSCVTDRNNQSPSEPISSTERFCINRNIRQNRNDLDRPIWLAEPTSFAPRWDLKKR